jgi:hypothetical protein
MSGEGEQESLECKELAQALPSPSGRVGDEMMEPQRKEPTAEDFERYKAYVGQKWTGVSLYVVEVVLREKMALF